MAGEENVPTGSYPIWLNVSIVLTGVVLAITFVALFVDVILGIEIPRHKDILNLLIVSLIAFLVLGYIATRIKMR